MDEKSLRRWITRRLQRALRHAREDDRRRLIAARELRRNENTTTRARYARACERDKKSWRRYYNTLKTFELIVDGKHSHGAR